MRTTTIALVIILCFNRLPAQTCTSPIGMNLGELNAALVDVFKTSQTFWETDLTTGLWDTGNPLTLDENGYPTSLRDGFGARTIMLQTFDFNEGNYSTGVYTLLFDGEGSIEVGHDAVNPVYIDNGGIDNRLTFEVNNPTFNGIIITIAATNPANYVRNIRIIRPDDTGTNYLVTYQTQNFRKILLDRLRNYSVLRFMDWMGTNFSPVQTWQDRTLTSHKNWSSNFGGGAGMPYELLIELCNTIGSSPWFCMPHQADDDFIRQFALLVKTHLDPSLDIYIEYSNEVWNGIFQDNAWYEGQSGQNSYAFNQAAARGWGCDDCYFERNGRWVAQRSVDIFTIWNEVFGGEAGRVKKVLPIQNGPGNSTPYVLDHKVNGVAAFQSADFVAGAPYFAGEFSPQTPGIESWTVEQLLDSVEVRMLAYDSGPYWAEQAMKLLNSPPYNSRSLRYIAYESGQHLFNVFGAPFDNVSRLFIEANRHPHMGELYRTYLNWWRDAGGMLLVLFMHDGAPGWGSFGLFESLEQDTLTAPKYLAVQQWIRDNCSVTSVIEKKISPNRSSLLGNNPNPFNPATTISYTISPNKSEPTSVHVTLQIFNIRGQEVATLVNKQQVSGNHKIQFDATSLPSGIYYVRLKAGKSHATHKMILVK